MVTRYVIDTSCLINYYNTVFGEKNLLSKKVRSLIDRSFSKSGDVLLVVPSIVLVEIYYKWFRSQEFAQKFFYEVYIPLKESPFIEIKPIEREVLENLFIISIDHDLHDKIILASAIMLNCPLITFDRIIIEYVTKTKIIPFTLS